MELNDWDVTKLLDHDEDVAAYLDAAMETGNAAFIVTAIGDVAKARGMTAIAEQALGDGGDPTLAGLLEIIRAFGLRLSVTA